MPQKQSQNYNSGCRWYMMWVTNQGDLAEECGNGRNRKTFLEYNVSFVIARVQFCSKERNNSQTKLQRHTFQRGLLQKVC